MNKKGFTLIELLAVIVVMSILVIMIVPNIDNMRQGVLERSLQSKIDDIETAAEDWAYDNINMLDIKGDQSTKVGGIVQYTNCTHVQVNELILKGYVIGDSSDKKQMINPIDKTSMNDRVVCVRYFIGNGFEKRVMHADLK